MDRDHFQGLASLPAAALLAGLVWIGASHEAYGDELAADVPATIIAGILMVGNVRYKSFKNLDLRGRVPFVR